MTRKEATQVEPTNSVGVPGLVFRVEGGMSCALCGNNANVGDFLVFKVVPEKSGWKLLLER